MSEFLSQYEAEPPLPKPEHPWRERFAALGALAGAATGIAILIASGDIPSALAAPALVDKYIGVGFDLMLGTLAGGALGFGLGYMLGLGVDRLVNSLHSKTNEILQP